MYRSTKREKSYVNKSIPLVPGGSKPAISGHSSTASANFLLNDSFFL